MADFGEVLWNDFLRHNPANPKWFNRDRVMLSNGHGSMLQYSLLHLSGYDLSDRGSEATSASWVHSKTPGHPGIRLRTPGVETTTGPLGQGHGQRRRHGAWPSGLLADPSSTSPGFPIVDHYTYVILGDGCLMEGISLRSLFALAGTWGLGKLICLYWDDNGISIDGHRCEGWFSDNVAEALRGLAAGMSLPNVDGHDPAAIHARPSPRRQGRYRLSVPP
jgi:transketolase